MVLRYHNYELKLLIENCCPAGQNNPQWKGAEVFMLQEMLKEMVNEIQLPKAFMCHGGFRDMLYLRYKPCAACDLYCYESP